MATGAQRQHFSVFSSLGISMGYTSVINQHARTVGQTGKELLDEDEGMLALEPDEDDGVDIVDANLGGLNTENLEAILQSKKQRTRTLGTLFDLSQACRSTARKLADTALFVIVYDNINMMVRVAEQILGRKSEPVSCFSYQWYKFSPE